MNWFKTKKSSHRNTSSASNQLHALVRTMEDDLAGRQVPLNVAEPAEPLVSFHPDVAANAPFFVASEITHVARPPHPVSEKESPFLQSSVVPEAEPRQKVATESQPMPEPEPASKPEPERDTFSIPVPQNTPVFFPPLDPVPPPSARSAVVKDQSSVPVIFNTTSQSVAPSPRELLTSFGSLGRAFLPLLQDRKIRIVIALSALLLFFVMCAGIYFGVRTLIRSKTIQPDIRVESPTVQTEVIQTEPLIQTRYSAAQPNLLSFDTETVTTEEIQSALLQVGQIILQDRLSGPVEFLIRDQKLNPLAFSRFAYLVKINIPAALLATLDESFSLYVFIDNGRPRVALLTYIKDESAFEAQLKKSENGLASAFETLFLDKTTAPKRNLLFRQGTYLGRPVRFANVDASLGLSVDYAVRGRQWIVGTSKDTLRSVLDKTGL